MSARNVYDNGQVVINEAMCSTIVDTIDSGNTDHARWVELRNTTDEPLSLELCSFDAGTRVSLTGVIPAHGFYVLSGNDGPPGDQRLDRLSCAGLQFSCLVPITPGQLPPVVTEFIQGPNDTIQHNIKVGYSWQSCPTAQASATSSASFGWTPSTATYAANLYGTPGTVNACP